MRRKNHSNSNISTRALATKFGAFFICLLAFQHHYVMISAQEEEEEFVFIADPVTEALEYVEAIERQRNNCSFGPSLNLEYSKARWRTEALVTVRAANLLTFFSRTNDHILGSHPDDVNILYSLVRANVNYYEKVFGSAIAFDLDLYRDYEIFCPYAFISPDGIVIAKDLSIGYDYHDNGTDWFWVPFEQFRNFDYREPSVNLSDIENRRLLVIEDGYWTQPYFDCGGGDVWMVTFSMPFFTNAHVFNDSSPDSDEGYIFAGVTTIDVVLDDLDINQCPRDVNADDSNVFDPFVNTHKCQNTTKCVQLSNQGFKRGTYQCQCEKGYYFPDVGSGQNAFNGTQVEEEFSKKIRGYDNNYDSFICLLCAEGCDECVDKSPCFLEPNTILRFTLAILQCVFIVALLGLGIFTFIMRNNKVIKAASPGLLYVFLFGAAITYSQVIGDALSNSDITCIIQPWLKYIGFSLAYGALLLKTWRITVVFKVRSAKPIRITDNNLYARMTVLVIVCCVGLAAWTIIEPPQNAIVITLSGMKYYNCSRTYWTYIGEAGELLLLAWGVYLCVKVRKAPSAFNEAKYISVCIYNKTLMSFFALVLISFVLPTLEGGADMYIIVEFARIHISMTMIVALLFGSKMYHVYNYDETQGTQTGTGFTKKTTTGPGTSTGTGKQVSNVQDSTISGAVDSAGPDLSFSGNEIQAEIERMKKKIHEIAEEMQLTDSEWRKIVKKSQAMAKMTKTPSKTTISKSLSSKAGKDNAAFSSQSSGGSSTRIAEDPSKPGPSNKI
ncbi:probable G-protein coupled receptor CG31760 [Amphiura filiformis]|uniref:probable G-protein coupled receptor CG31760 n=1 Tax=Amphiura filiformis TaxID=82378 RepID=UPI003B22452B